MGGPPQKKGPNVGLIIGLGCLGLLVLGGIGTAVGFWYVGKKAASAISSLPTAPPGKGGTRGSTVDPDDPLGLKPSGNMKAELKDLRNYKADYGNTIHFVGELHNTGTDAIGFPNAKVTFFDDANTQIDSGTCASLIRQLEPGAKVPCTFSLFKTTKWASYKTEITPMRPLFTGKSADLKITDTKFTPKRGFQPHQVDGKITNNSSFKAKSVWALVSLYDASGKIVGADQALVAGNDLAGGSSGLFSAKIYNVAAPPDTFRVVAIGYSE